MKKVRQQKPAKALDSSSIVVADAVARGHANAGRAAYEQLQVTYSESQRLGTPIDVQEVLALAIPATTNLSLGLEIFLKLLAFQRTGCFPGGHDMRALFSNLPSDAAAEVRDEYERRRMHPERPHISRFTIAFGAFAASAQQEPEPQSADDAVERIGRAYEEWRYVYEKMPGVYTSRPLFEPLLLMIGATDAAIRNHRSGDLVIVQRGAVGDVPAA